MENKKMECKNCRNEFEKLEYDHCPSCWEQVLKNIDEYGFPCSNHDCVFVHEGGMGTNGGCHCLDYFPMPRALKNRLKNILHVARGRGIKRGRREAMYWVQRAVRDGVKLDKLVDKMKEEML